MQTFKKFIANHSALAHTLVVVWGFLAGFYFDNATAHTYIDTVALNLYNSTPHWLQGVIVGLLIPLITYWKAQKRAPAGDGTAAARKLGLLVLACFTLCCVASAQAGVSSSQVTTPVATAPAAPTSLGLSGESDALAVHFNGEWSAGTLVTESFDFLDFGTTKGNHLFLVGQQFLAPTPGLQAYLGGVVIQPDFTKLLNKTNVPTGNFSAFFSGSVGNGLPATGGSHISFMAGGGVKYTLTTSLTWQTIQGYYGRIGSQPFEAISTGLSFVFGKPGQ